MAVLVPEPERHQFGVGPARREPPILAVERRHVVGMSQVEEVSAEHLGGFVAAQGRRGGRHVNPPAIEVETDDHVVHVLCEQAIERLAPADAAREAAQHPPAGGKTKNGQ